MSNLRYEPATVQLRGLYGRHAEPRMPQKGSRGSATELIKTILKTLRYEHYEAQTT